MDAQLSPVLAEWIRHSFPVNALSLRELGLSEAKDRDIYAKARSAKVIVMTKDIDFIHLLEQQGPPPQIIWITCGNTSNFRMKQILSKTLKEALKLLEAGESIVEISDLSRSA